MQGVFWWFVRLNNIYSLSCTIMWNNIVQYNIDRETRQKAYINLAQLAIQVRGGWNFIVKKIKKNKKGEGTEFEHM